MAVISNSDSYSLVSGGNDKISNSGQYSTVNAGTGDETIRIKSLYASSNVIRYDEGDGNDLIVPVGEGRITLSGAATLGTVNILGTLFDDTQPPEEPVHTVYPDNKFPKYYTAGKGVTVVDATARTKAIEITGNDLDNSIVGSAKNDTIYGEEGADTIYGGKGNDSLWGDEGADVFVYNSGEGRDIINDFDDNDLLQITGTFTTAYDSAAGTIKFTIGTGSITLTDFTTTTFNVNGDIYEIQGTRLVKK